MIRDVSSAGIGLLLDRCFGRGTFLELRLNDPRHRGLKTLFLEVVRAGKRAGGHWSVGCTFLEPLSDGQLEALLKQETLGKDGQRA